MYLLTIINKIVGSITHWTLRPLIAAVFKKLGIRISRRFEFRLAYFLTGLLLVGVGFWTYHRLW